MKQVVVKPIWTWYYIFVDNETKRNGKTMTDYSDYNESLDSLLANVQAGHVLVIRAEMEMDDYFGPLEGMPTESPIYIDTMYFNATENDTERYPLGLLDAEYFYCEKYLPILQAIVDGLVAEVKWANENEYSRYACSVDYRLDDYQEQLNKLQNK